MAPLAHRPDLPSLDDGERDGLAAALVVVLTKLDRLFDAPMPYMLWVHQRPTDDGGHQIMCNSGHVYVCRSALVTSGVVSSTGSR